MNEESPKTWVIINGDNLQPWVIIYEDNPSTLGEYQLITLQPWVISIEANNESKKNAHFINHHFSFSTPDLI